MNAILRDNFQRKFREALNARGMTPAQLARKIGVSRQAVEQYARGEHCPSLDLVERYAVALEVDPWNLIDDQPLKILSTIE